MRKNMMLVLLCFTMLLNAGGTDSPFGICAHVSRQPEWKTAGKEFDVMKQGGIQWVRTDFDWKHIEKKPGVWDFSHLDTLVKTAEEKKIRILPILDYDVPWARPVYRHLDKWREYVRKTVSRYASRLRCWEVWNEANHHSTYVEPEHYTEILKAAYEEIKKIDPEIQVLYMGSAGVPIPYIEKTIECGAARYFDIMNIHPYAWNSIPEETKEQLDPLKTLFERHNIKKPIWVTEFSWATHKWTSPAPIIAAAVKSLGMDPKTVPVAKIRRNRNPGFRETYILSDPDFTHEIFPNRHEINLDELKNLDPKKYPILVPSTDEAFPHKGFRDLLKYVKSGGILILSSNGFPFYYDLRSTESGKQIFSKKSSEAFLKQLHIGWLSAWKNKLPRNGNVYSAPGFEFKDGALPSGERYLSSKNLREGDRLIPVMLQRSGDFIAPILGIYQLNSDLKSAVIMNVSRSTSGVPQEVQGKFLPRGYLLFLSYGYQKIFWYKFLAEEYSDTCNGHHFGIVHRNLAPRDAFRAYQTLTKMYTPGSTIPTLKNNGNLYECVWKRTDGKTIHAYWTTGRPEDVLLSYPIAHAYDYLGREVFLPGQRLSASDGITYLIEK